MSVSSVMWIRTNRPASCGGCGKRLSVGMPVRMLRNNLQRCADCAKTLLGEDVPSALPDETSAPADDGTASAIAALVARVLKRSEDVVS